jgi:hypothetical protein
LWDLHVAKTWGVGSIAFYFLIAAGIYLQARLVSPRIPKMGELDLRAFHSEEGRKYLIAYTFLSWMTVAVNAVIGQANGLLQWSAQNMVIVPMALMTTWPRFSSDQPGSSTRPSQFKSEGGSGTSVFCSRHCHDKKGLEFTHPKQQAHYPPKRFAAIRLGQSDARCGDLLGRTVDCPKADVHHRLNRVTLKQ